LANTANLAKWTRQQVFRRHVEARILGTDKRIKQVQKEYASKL
jgi:hypothetical protein